jgi:hypothetical protein
VTDDSRDSLTKPHAQAVAYLFPESINTYDDGSFARGSDRRSFVFQYWPESVSDSHPANYASKEVPGGTLPLHQWTGGGERTISFDAVFTTEIADEEAVRQANHQGIPSARYSVNVKAAIARLESYKLPKYPRNGQNGRVIPPGRLVLVLPKSNLGRNSDQVLVILKEVSWNYESWFPDGTLRVAQAGLSFSESAQHSLRSGERGSNIRFVDRSIYTDDLLNRYNFSHGNINRGET